MMSEPVAGETAVVDPLPFRYSRCTDGSKPAPSPLAQENRDGPELPDDAPPPSTVEPGDARSAAGTRRFRERLDLPDLRRGATRRLRPGQVDAGHLPDSGAQAGR